MSDLVERLAGFVEQQLPLHAFYAIMRERARGNMTGAQALEVANRLRAQNPLTTEQRTQAQALLALIDAKTGLAAKIEEAQRQFDILLCAQYRPEAYPDAAAVRLKLGV